MWSSEIFFDCLRISLVALNRLIDENLRIISTKRIRKFTEAMKFDRIRIYHVAMSLNYLNIEGIIELREGVKPKSYGIKIRKKIDVDQFVDLVKKGRHYSFVPEKEPVEEIASEIEAA